MLPGEPVVVLTAGTSSDSYSGDDVTDWTTPTEVTYDNVLVADNRTVEPSEVGRDQVDADFMLLFQTPNVTITAYDRVRVRSQVCEVVGQPFLWQLPPWQPGVRVYAKIAVG